MTRSEIKKEIIITILLIFDMVISFFITNYLGITNIILIKSYTAMSMDITWEVLIFLGLAFIEVASLELYNKR